MHYSCVERLDMHSVCRSDAHAMLCYAMLCNALSVPHGVAIEQNYAPCMLLLA